MAKVNLKLLTALAGETFLFVGSKDRAALLSFSPALAEENLTMVDPSDSDKVAVRITDAGRQYLNDFNKENTVTETAPSTFGIISGIELPAVKRGGGGGTGAPSKYPFDALEVGQTFFVPVSEKMPDPVKSLAGAVSGANLKYANETGTKTITRKKRDGRNIAHDENGEPIMETVEVPTYEYTRKFVTRSVEKGVAYGTWVAPENGAIVARVQ